MSRSSLKSVQKLIDIANKEEAIEDSFLHDLCRSIELTEEKSWGGIPSQTFKPSSMQCKRNSYYQIMGVQPDIGEASHVMIGIANSGTDIHVRVQDAVAGMKDNGIDCEYVDVGDYVESHNLKDIVVREKKGNETKLYNKRYNISFMCDGIIKYRGEYYILEIKSETSNKWYSRLGVDKKHYNQGIAYSLSLGIDKVLFLYIERDMLNKKAYMFNVTHKMKDELVHYIESVDGYIERKIVPPKDDKDRRVCNYCAYQSQCRKDG